MGRPLESSEPDDRRMLWSRTDVDEDFDPKILILAQVKPLSGKGFYTILRNLIYMRAPEPFVLDKWAWKRLKAVMPIPRKQFDAMLEVVLECELLDRLHYEQTGELTSKRIRQEIAGRFSDMTRSQRYRDAHRDGDRDDRCDETRDDEGDSRRFSPPTVNSTQLTDNRKQKTGYRRHGRSFSAPSNGSRAGEAVVADQEAMRRLGERGEPITRDSINAEVAAMRDERNNGVQQD